MEITINLSFLSETFIFIANNVNFNALFASVFCLLAFFAVTKITLNLLADKEIRFSFLSVILYVMVGGIMFAISYTEYKFVGDVFTDLAEVLFYSIGESVALIALYVAFLCFAKRQEGIVEQEKFDLDFYLPKTYKAKIEEVPLSDVPVVRLRTSNKNEPKIKVVDIDGALKYLDEQIMLGKSNLKPIRDKIAFYCGAELKKEDVVYLNDLFSKAIRL